MTTYIRIYERRYMIGVEQGVSQGCSLSPILFSVFISDLLEEIDRASSDRHSTLKW